LSKLYFHRFIFLFVFKLNFLKSFFQVLVLLFVPFDFLSEAVFKLSVFFVWVFNFLSFTINKQSQSVHLALKLFNVGLKQLSKILNLKFGKFFKFGLFFHQGSFVNNFIVGEFRKKILFVFSEVKCFKLGWLFLMNHFLVNIFQILGLVQKLLSGSFKFQVEWVGFKLFLLFQAAFFWSSVSFVFSLEFFQVNVVSLFQVFHLIFHWWELVFESVLLQSFKRFDVVDFVLLLFQLFL
jgi:hypothetical protein